MPSFILAAALTLFSLYIPPAFAQTLSSDDQERITILQNAVKLHLPVTDLEVMFKYAFAMNKAAITNAGLTTLNDLPDQIPMIQFVKDFALKTSDCALTVKAIDTIGQMGKISQIDVRRQAAIQLSEISNSMDTKTMACIKNQSNETENLNKKILEAMQKLQ